MLYQACLASLLVAAAVASFVDLHDPNHDIPIHLLLARPRTRASACQDDLRKIRYLLWTRSNADDYAYYQLLPFHLNSLRASPLVPSLPTYVLYHGFNDMGLVEWITRSKTALLRQQECNVISVDWGALVPAPWYFTAVQNTFRTANHTASLLNWIEKEVGLRPAQLHIIGHSLGAHTAGLTAKGITGGTVGRVTGLDPAGPLFYTNPPDQRIDRSDAAFVDILHTNSGSILEGCMGMFKPLGHADFYPNGGMHQPGCAILYDLMADWLDLMGCSHARATVLWVESLEARPPSPTFTAWPCYDWDPYTSGQCPTCGQGCVDMGYPAPPGTEGTYFLRTDPSSPYALGPTQ